MRTAVRIAKLDRPYSHVLVAETNGRLVGALNAAPWPHCQLRAGEKLKVAPTMLRVLGRATLRQLKLSAAWAKHDPQERHWHLGPIGVHPEYQGRGVGTALLGTFLTMVDEQRSPAYLETDVASNVVLYEKFGFHVIAHKTSSASTTVSCGGRRDPPRHRATRPRSALVGRSSDPGAGDRHEPVMYVPAVRSASRRGLSRSVPG